MLSTTFEDRQCCGSVIPGKRRMSIVAARGAQR
jgi:hypothetical protein